MNNHRMIPHVRVILLIAVAAFFVGNGPALASVCTLADHIKSANTNTAVGFCPAGTSHDIITIAEDVTLTEPLPPITGTITIEGGGHTISGDDQFRIFDVQGGNLTIKNLMLSEGRADHGGAVRLQAGSLTVYDSSFVGNRTEKSAGAIYASGGTLQIRDSRFEDNCAQLASYTLREGVNRDARSVDADGCTRVRYTRSEIDGEVQLNVDGGAIRLLNGAQAIIERLHLYQQQSDLWRGDFDIQQRNDRLVVNGSSFLGNHASDTGGAIGAVWSGGGASTISNSSMVKNSAKNAAGAIDAAASGRWSISNSTFSENQTEGNGGALQVGWERHRYRYARDLHRKPGEELRVTRLAKRTGRCVYATASLPARGSADDCVWRTWNKALAT